MGEKPTGAMVLSVIGGVFIMLVGLLFIAIASLVASFAGMIPNLPTDPVAAANQIYLLGAIGVLHGIAIIALGVVMYMKPQMARVLGVIVLVLAIVSFFDTLGGFFIGFILALIGGILGIVFKPQQPMMMAPPPMAPPQMP